MSHTYRGMKSYLLLLSDTFCGSMMTSLAYMSFAGSSRDSVGGSSFVNLTENKTNTQSIHQSVVLSYVSVQNHFFDNDDMNATLILPLCAWGSGPVSDCSLVMAQLVMGNEYTTIKRAGKSCLMLWRTKISLCRYKDRYVLRKYTHNVHSLGF